MIVMEEWRDIKGYEGKYQVSNLLNVRSLNYHRENRIKNMVTQVKKGGYLIVGLRKNGIRKFFFVHRLAAIAFLPIPDELKDIPIDDLTIDHIIPLSVGGKNELSNLRWTTREGNSNNPLTIINLKKISKGIVRSDEFKRKVSESKKGKGTGTTNPNAKPILQYSIDGTFIKEWDCIIDAVKKLNLSQSGISQVLTGKRKTSGGFIWKYKEVA